MTARTWIIACTSAVVFLGCAADQDSVCDQAADHIASCLGEDARPTDQCESGMAERILEQDCDELMASQGKGDFLDFLCEVFGIFCPEPEPCECGDSCTICDPTDPDCFETAVPKFCQANGSCAATVPVCEGDDDFDPCEGKTCGDECTICDPADPDCFETAVIKMCNADGMCEPSVPVCEEAKCCDLADQPGALGNPFCIEGATCCADGTWECNNGAGGSTCAEDGETCEIEECGGFLGLLCEDDSDLCVDIPFDGCDPDDGGADCGGMCVDSIPCGGFAGLLCPSDDFECVDDPTDSCDPLAGGADCIGTCMPK